MDFIVNRQKRQQNNMQFLLHKDKKGNKEAVIGKIEPDKISGQVIEKIKVEYEKLDK